MVRVDFEREKVIEAAGEDQTLLEISRAAGIPHVAACGGNARCSTCRVVVVDHLENVEPRTPAEQQLAKRKGFDDNIRLACQTKVCGPVTVRRLVIDEEDMRMIQSDRSPNATGKDRRLAILFSDIRNFTPFAESHLPYDVIHILGRYFRKMGGPVLEHGGYIDKYMGDGIMAIFGLSREDPADACLDAVSAGLGMLAALDDLNHYLKRQFDTTFRIGIGIHVGPVIIGEMGHPEKMQFTAIGDPVNIASRIESATKEFGASLLVSEDVCKLIGERIEVGRRKQVNLKGKTGSHQLTEVLGLAPEQST